jgi:hypothetical protein
MFILRFEVITAGEMLMLVLWVVTLCGLVGRYQCFEGKYGLHLQVSQEDEDSMFSETLVSTYKFTQHYNP